LVLDTSADPPSLWSKVLLVVASRVIVLLVADGKQFPP
jgi:hypothetical protein